MAGRDIVSTTPPAVGIAESLRRRLPVRRTPRRVRAPLLCTRATLTKARLSGATLTKADLSEADLVSAFWSEETQWPSEYGAGVRERSVSLSDGRWRIQEVGNSGADPSEPPPAPTG